MDRDPFRRLTAAGREIVGKLLTERPTPTTRIRLNVLLLGAIVATTMAFLNRAPSDSQLASRPGTTTSSAESAAVTTVSLDVVGPAARSAGRVDEGSATLPTPEGLDVPATTRMAVEPDPQPSTASPEPSSTTSSASNVTSTSSGTSSVATSAEPRSTTTAGPPPTVSTTDTKPTIVEGPIARNDRIVVETDKDIKIDVLDNDESPTSKLDKDTLTIVSGPSLAREHRVDGDRLRYRAPKDVTGFDQLVYRICDEEARCAEATVSIEIVDR